MTNVECRMAKERPAFAQLRRGEQSPTDETVIRAFGYWNILLPSPFRASRLELRVVRKIGVRGLVLRVKSSPEFAGA
jgi:hypothetical protein